MAVPSRLCIVSVLGSPPYISPWNPFWYLCFAASVLSVGKVVAVCSRYQSCRELGVAGRLGKEFDAAVSRLFWGNSGREQLKVFCGKRRYFRFTAMCLDKKPCQDPTSPGVWWRDDADWKHYDALQAAAIERGIADGASMVDLGNVVSSKYTSGTRYVVNLCTMEQVNLNSLYTRSVKIVKVPATSPGTAPAKECDNTSTKEEVRARKMHIRSLKNVVLKLESELLALKVQLLENEVKRVAATAATANQVVDLQTRCTPGFASHNASRDPVCEGCDPEAYWASEYLCGGVGGRLLNFQGQTVCKICNRLI